VARKKKLKKITKSNTRERKRERVNSHSTLANL